MSITQKDSQRIESNPTTLFDLLFYFPVGEQDAKDYKKIDTNIRLVILAIRKLQKNKISQIEGVCNTNKKLIWISKFLFNQKISFIVINLFTHLLVSLKMLNFIVKISVPLFIYRNLIRLLQKQRDKISLIQKDKQIQESFKFVYQFCKLDPKRFPRCFANLLSGTVTYQYSSANKKQSSNQSPPSPTWSLILDTCIEILKNNVRLAAQSQILQNLYNKILTGEVQIEKTKIIMDLIVNFCTFKDTRQIIHSCIDLGKAFARFNNVDMRHLRQNYSQSKQEYEQNLIKSCIVIQILLSSWSTLIYFVSQKTTLINFIKGIPLKSTVEVQAIKNHILKKMISRTLAYDKYRMTKSLNIFGFKSNYLNYRGLVLMNFLLRIDSLYEIFETISKDGQLLQSTSSLCLQYFPHIFQNQKYNKKIIKNIKFSEHYQNFIINQAYRKNGQSKKEQILAGLKDFSKPSLIQYYYEPKQIRNYLIWLKQDPIVFNSFSEELREEIQINLNQVKIECQNKSLFDKNKTQAILANFYKVGIQACELIPWKTQNLKFFKFLSSILQFLVNHDYDAIFTILIRIMKTIFEKPQQNLNRYLICDILDDLGKFLLANQDCQEIILKNYKNQAYAFRISRILLNIDYEKSTDKFNKSKFQNDALSPKKLLEFFCTKQAADQIILQIIEIIKKICSESLQKNQIQSSFLIQLISTNLIYHKNQEIVLACIQFFEEIILHKSSFLQKYIKNIKIDKIHTQFQRKKMAYLILVYEGGFETINQLYPQFFKEELQNWMKKQSNGLKQNSYVLKQYQNFILRQVKRFNDVFSKQKDKNEFNSLFLGFEEEQRRNLLNLPWNVKVNSEYYPAFAGYKMLKERIKLRVRVFKIITEPQIVISVLNIGSNSIGREIKQDIQNQTLITIRSEQIMKSYQRNKSKEVKQAVIRFAVKKQQVDLVFRVNQKQQFILQKLTVNINLQKNIYRPLLYPINFIYIMTMTKSGNEFLKKQKIFQTVLDKVTNSLASFQVLRPNLLLLGCLCAGQRSYKESVQKKQIEDILMKIIWRILTETGNYEIKQICHWILNILIKDDDMKKRIKDQKLGVFVQTKYSRTLYYYPYTIKNIQAKQQEFDSTGYIRKQMPQKLMYQTQFKQIYQFLNNQTKQLEMLNFQRLAALKSKQFSNPKVFQNIVKYMSLMNYSNQKINIVFQMYKKYLPSEKFEQDFFTNGFLLPGLQNQEKCI